MNHVTARRTQLVRALEGHLIGPSAAGCLARAVFTLPASTPLCVLGGLGLGLIGVALVGFGRVRRFFATAPRLEPLHDHE
jgi:hypothetical protein